VRADFGHEEDAVALPFKSAAHPVFGFAAMVFPAVIKERDAAIDGFIDYAFWLWVRLGRRRGDGRRGRERTLKVQSRKTGAGVSI
jgi:hypothetical protein